MHVEGVVVRRGEEEAVGKVEEYSRLVYQLAGVLID